MNNFCRTVEQFRYGESLKWTGTQKASSHRQKSLNRSGAVEPVRGQLRIAHRVLVDGGPVCCRKVTTRNSDCGHGNRIPRRRIALVRREPSLPHTQTWPRFGGAFFSRGSHGCCHLPRFRRRPLLRRKGAAPRQLAHGSTCHRARCEHCAR
jgi:hypothetical protein